jgi:hypothetical protein
MAKEKRVVKLMDANGTKEIEVTVRIPKKSKKRY